MHLAVNREFLGLAWLRTAPYGPVWYGGRPRRVAGAARRSGRRLGGITNTQRFPRASQVRSYVGNWWTRWKEGLFDGCFPPRCPAALLYAVYRRFLSSILDAALRQMPVRLPTHRRCIFIDLKLRSQSKYIDRPMSLVSIISVAVVCVTRLPGCSLDSAVGMLPFAPLGFDMSINQR